MADFGSLPSPQYPQLGQVNPRTVLDVGALINLAAAGAGTTTGAVQYNTSSRGLRVVAKLTKNSGTIDVTINIYSIDKATGAAILRLASVSLTANGTTEYIISPDLTAAANSIAKNFIGEQWRVDVVSGAGSSPNFDLIVGGCLLP